MPADTITLRQHTVDKPAGRASQIRVHPSPCGVEILRDAGKDLSNLKAATLGVQLPQHLAASLRQTLPIQRKGIHGRHVAEYRAVLLVAVGKAELPP